VDILTILAIIVIVFAVGFDFTNGFHDASNAIATAISTHALSPKVALIIAAVMNFGGALLGTAVATTIATQIVNLPYQDGTSVVQGLSVQHAQFEALSIVLAALVGAICWNLLTWRLGLPCSSTHSIIGGLAGAGLAGSFFFTEVSVQWMNVVEKVIIPMVISPVIGFVLAYLIMVLAKWVLRRANPHKAGRGFRRAQIFSASALALGHGLQDAQKTMGIVFMAAMVVGIGGVNSGTTEIPIWIKALAALSIAAGTYSGGFRIMKTLGRKITKVDPIKGFVAESISAAVLYTTSFGFAAPVSTTHIITSAVMGVGSTEHFSHVHWGVAGNIVTAWVLTLPGAGVIGALVYLVLHALNL
jgi:PiT family inorganic phosphate transporter